jgi:hypothetical protein
VSDVPKFGLDDTAHPAQHETAEEEKARLQREERERILHSSNPPASTTEPSAQSGSGSAAYESAEDEKQRLEREERERYVSYYLERESGLIMMCDVFRNLRGQAAAAAADTNSEHHRDDEPEDDTNVPPPYEEPQ